MATNLARVGDRTQVVEACNIRVRRGRRVVRAEAEALLRERDEGSCTDSITRPWDLIAVAADVDAVLGAARLVDLVDPDLQALLAPGLLGGARLMARLHEGDGLAARAHEVGQACDETTAGHVSM